MFTQAETDFNLDRHLISFLQDSPFFAELSRHIQKTPTRSIPTAAVAFNEKNDEIVMYWNPEFFGSLSPREIRGVINHEYYHLVFGHVQARRKTPPQLWNVATDLAINSILLDKENKQYSSHVTGDRILPEFALVPGVFPKHPEGRDFTADEKQGMKLAEIIAKLPPMQSSEWYFEKIKEEAEKQGMTPEELTGEGNIIVSMDDHDAWDSIPEEKREYVEGKVRAMVEKAAKHADAQANGWGNMSADMIEAIRKSITTVINWRNVLRQFVGNLVKGGRSTSIKRINKRYPYIHPGVKKGYVAKILVAIDQSGSVSNNMLAEFFGELGSLTKNVTIDVVPFDTIALNKDVYTWRKGANIPAKRVRGGGTDFNAPTQLANDPKNRGRWDGLLIMTDGECAAPGPSRIRRGYVLGKGCKMHFHTSDVLVQMDNAKQINGAWR